MKRHHRLLAGLVLLASVPGCSPQQGPAGQDPSAFILINARIIDGTGAPSVPGSVRVRGGLIEQVGDLEPAAGERVIDVGGKVLAPGFIDIHSHADSQIFDVPDAVAATSQGVTTVVVGQDGDSSWPLRDFFLKLEENPAAINVASYTGHGTIRDKAMGQDFRRHASDAEIAAMAGWLQEDMEAGSLGLSSGLEYDPGIYSAREEILALATTAASMGGRYASHIRSEDRWFEDALEEIISVGRATGMPVHISHFKLGMKRLWGQAPAVLARLDEARAEGIDVTADIYPYEFWKANLMVLLPERDTSDRQAAELALAEIAPPEGVRLTAFLPNPEYVGKSLVEIAELNGTDPVSTFLELAAASQAWRERTGNKQSDGIIATSMLDSDIRELFAWPHTSVSTDGGLVYPHPRAYGTFPLILGRYVREEQLMTLEAAVFRMTALAASQTGLADRGVIRAGVAADLVLFDPDTIIDRATAAEPQLLSDGILSVWVNGTQVFADGAATGARPGVPVRRQE